jgi:hypothetical protein
MGWWDYTRRKLEPRPVDRPRICHATAKENDLGNVLAVDRMFSGF